MSTHKSFSLRLKGGNSLIHDLTLSVLTGDDHTPGRWERAVNERFAAHRFYFSSREEDIMYKLQDWGLELDSAEALEKEAEESRQEAAKLAKGLKL